MFYVLENSTKVRETFINYFTILFEKQFTWDSSYQYFATLSGKVFQLEPFYQIFPNLFYKSGSIGSLLSIISQRILKKQSN